MKGNDVQTISSLQMSMLLFAFMTGSAIINIPGPLINKAYNAAWISLLISGGLSMLLLGCLLYLHRIRPEASFVECSRSALGTWITWILSLPTLSFLLHINTGIVMDVGLFMNSSMLRETPNAIFNVSIFALAALTARAGVEVMARMFTLILILIVPLSLVVLALGLPNYHASSLLPLLPMGFKPVWHGAYFSFGFPFEEVFVFGMLLRYAKPSDRNRLPRSLMIGLSLCIALLILSTMCTLMMFGPLAADKKYSLFELARVIDVFQIIQRIESIIGMALIAGSYMKSSIALYVLTRYIADLFKLNNGRTLIVPLALIGFLNTMVSFDGSTEWVEIVSVVHPLWGFLGFTLPLLLTAAVTAIRGQRHSGSRQAN